MIPQVNIETQYLLQYLGSLESSREREMIRIKMNQLLYFLILSKNVQITQETEGEKITIEMQQLEISVHPCMNFKHTYSTKVEDKP